MRVVDPVQVQVQGGKLWHSYSTVLYSIKDTLTIQVHTYSRTEIYAGSVFRGYSPITDGWMQEIYESLVKE
jgi:hypothetical protein